MRRHSAIELLSASTLERAPIFDLVRERIRLPSGLEQDLVVVEHPPAVCVAAFTAPGELLLVRQYRHPAGDWLLEVPAGRVDEGEEPLAAARRELEEETGHRAEEWEEIRSFFCAPGFCSEEMHVFVASGVRPVEGGGRPSDPDEEIELVRLPLERVLAEARDAKTLVTAALLALRAARPTRE